jgi:hypothetical protein
VDDKPLPDDPEERFYLEKRFRYEPSLVLIRQRAIIVLVADIVVSLIVMWYVTVARPVPHHPAFALAASILLVTGGSAELMGPHRHLHAPGRRNTRCAQRPIPPVRAHAPRQAVELDLDGPLVADRHRHRPARRLPVVVRPPTLSRPAAQVTRCRRERPFTHLP